MLNHYQFNKNLADGSYADVKKAFPDHAEKAHQIIVDYLKRYDRRRMRIFLGETADPNYEAGALFDAHYLISSMLREVSLGNPKATQRVIDHFARLYLQLPYAVIEGGA